MVCAQKCKLKRLVDKGVMLQKYNSFKKKQPKYSFFFKKIKAKKVKSIKNCDIPPLSTQPFNYFLVLLTVTTPTTYLLILSVAMDAKIE